MKRIADLRLVVLGGAVLWMAGVAMPVRAQDSDDLTRGVARISLINGDVSVRRGDSGEWVAGVINAPLMTDDRIATGQNSRAVVEFDGSNILRIGGNAEVRLAQLEAGIYHIEIAKGTVTYRVLHASTANVELNTPSVSVRPSHEGSFRITVDDASQTEITAREGDVEVFTPKGTQWVYSGQTMMARGDQSDPEFQMVTALSYDDWDRWNDSQDQSLLQSTSSQYVPQGVYGTEDLDTAGTWADVAPYGYVWRPTVVVAGWSPYRFGRWAWEDWYGWTWISYDPWGWAPYHYGRWFFDGGLGWCWYPGAFGMRAYWSPALVGFFGFGRGVGLRGGFGFGNIGWVPLAPFEAFHPWWGRGVNAAGGFNRGLLTNVNVASAYRNARVGNSIAAVRAEDFQNGRFGSIQRLSGSQVGMAGAIRGQMPVTPGRASRQFADRPAPNIAHASDNMRFFSAGQQGARGAGQGTANRSAGTAAQAGFRRFGETGATQAARPARTQNQSPASSSEGLRRFGQPGATQPTQQTQQTQRGNGWSSFGTPGSSTPARQPYNPPRQTNPDQRQTQRNYTPPRQSTPSYSAPRQSAPSYSAPRQSAPSYSAPRQSAPSYSAPRSAPPSGGGGHPASSGGGHSSGGGGHGGGGRH